MIDFSLGIDIAKTTFEAALLKSNKFHTASFSNNQSGFNQLVSWLEKHQAGRVPVCIEATSRYADALALTLHQLGYPVSVVNPLRIKAYAQSLMRRNKTDREDAKVIALFCLAQQPDLWSPPCPFKHELQALSRHRRALVQMRTQQLNRLQSGALPIVIESIQTIINCLDEQIKQTDQQMQQLIQQQSQLEKQAKLLMTIPGIGQQTAMRLLAELPDIAQFSSARQLAAYAGLTPRHRQSGSSVRGQAHLSKTGSSYLRDLLYMPAVTAMRWNPIVKALCDRLQQGGKNPMTIIGACMRKMLHLVYGILKTGKPFDPDYAVKVLQTA